MEVDVERKESATEKKGKGLFVFAWSDVRKRQRFSGRRCSGAVDKMARLVCEAVRVVSGSSTSRGLSLQVKCGWNVLAILVELEDASAVDYGISNDILLGFCSPFFCIVMMTFRVSLAFCLPSCVEGVVERTWFLSAIWLQIDPTKPVIAHHPPPFLLRRLPPLPLQCGNRHFSS